MAIFITRVSEDLIVVNKKQVRKDMNNNWVCKVGLTSLEQETLENHLQNEIV